MEIVKIENLNKYYGKGEALVKAIDEVNLTIYKGEFIAIVGSSGSGKSTLMHMLGGVDKPTNGKILVNNQNIYQYSERQLSAYRRREVGLIYQFYNLIPTLNVIENIKLPILFDKGKVDETYLEELLLTLNLKERTRHLPNQLSGGQQQRVAIARGLINRPALLLADEPTGNLDQKNGREILQLLKLANLKYGQTIVMITHDREIAKMANRIITIEDGKIVADEVNHASY